MKQSVPPAVVVTVIVVIVVLVCFVGFKALFPSSGGGSDVNSPKYRADMAAAAAAQQANMDKMKTHGPAGAPPGYQQYMQQQQQQQGH